MASHSVHEYDVGDANERSIGHRDGGDEKQRSSNDIETDYSPREKQVSLY